MKKFIQISIISIFSLLLPSIAGANEIIITINKMVDGTDFSKKSTCKLKFNITNNSYGTIHRIRAKLDGWDDRGEKLREMLSAMASNSKGFSYVPISKGNTISNVGDATFKVKCKYLAEIKYIGIADEDCAMKMLPENQSCSKFTVMNSNVSSIKIKK